MTLITPEYLALQQRMHTEQPRYGRSGGLYVESVTGLSMRYRTGDVLDYGCGKGTLGREFVDKIKEYDPAIPGKDTLPEPADLVVCTDVLEHVEPDALEAVLQHLRSLTKKALYVVVHCQPAEKSLPDGRNAHLVQQPPHWWLLRFMDSGFHLQSFAVSGKGFWAVME